jgi:uncharacterized membrane protein YphA (DoxX/SURF4 family)
MILNTLHNQIAAALLPRLLLGVLFLFQGFDAVFRVKLKGIMAEIQPTLIARGVPLFLITVGAYFTSYIELICGILVILGFVKYYALYLLGIDLLLATFAFSLVKPMWDMSHVFPRIVLLLFILIIPSNWDVISVDYVWSQIKFPPSF